MLAHDVLPEVVVRGRPNPLHSKLPERLKAAREAADIKHTSLSLAAELSVNTAFFIERGRVPGVDVVEHLARVLSVSPCYLAFGVDGGASGTAGAPLSCIGLGARLAAAREARGWSRREMAREARSSDTTIRGIEEGREGRLPSVATVEQLAKALGVSPCWLAYGEGGMERPPKPPRKKATKKAPLAERRARAPLSSSGIGRRARPA